MSFLEQELGKITEKLAGTVSTKAKDSAISTLKDPEFKATVNQFTREWFHENREIIGPVVMGFFILSTLAILNIISNFRARR